MPSPQDKSKPIAPRVHEAPSFKVVSPPGIHQGRSEAIAELTAKGRTLHAEMVANTEKIADLQDRNTLIQRSLAEIHKTVIEHAWDGQPLC